MTHDPREREVAAGRDIWFKFKHSRDSAVLFDLDQTLGRGIREEQSSWGVGDAILSWDSVLSLCRQAGRMAGGPTAGRHADHGRSSLFNHYTLWFIIPITLLVLGLLLVVMLRFPPSKNPVPSRTATTR